MNKKLLALAILAVSTGATAVSAAESKMIETPRVGVYADTEWATAHGGPRNDDYIPSIQELPRYYDEKNPIEVLRGSAVLLGPTRGPNGDFYVTTARETGVSNFTAFSADGEIKWQTPPWQSANDFDPGGVIAAPAVDNNGDIYISDATQMWAFHPDGSVKWITELPPPTVGHSDEFKELNLEDDILPNTITNPFFTMPVDGDESTAYVGGVTIYGDVIIFDRETGQIQNELVNMPGDFVTDVLEPAPGAMAPPFVAQGWGEVIWTYFHGGVESANVPAVHPETGMIYATGTSSKTEKRGAIHGFTFDPKTKKVEFKYEAEIGEGSGSSPAISSDLKYIYASDDEAVLHKYSTSDDQDLVWTSDVAGRPASASLGGPGDDKIYVYDERYVYAVNPETGEADWSVDMQKFAIDMLSEQPLANPMICGFSAFHNGIVVSTANELLITGVLGYELGLTGCPESVADEATQQLATKQLATNKVAMSAKSGPSAVIPTAQIQGVWAVDPKTGEILRDGKMIPAMDTNEAFTVPTTDGYLLMDRGVLSSGINEAFRPLTSQMFAEDNQPITALGGVEVLQGMDDIKITTKTSGVTSDKGAVLFDEAFAKDASSFVLQSKGKEKKEIKGTAEGAGDISYHVNVKTDGKGNKVHGTINIKKGSKTIHSIKVEEGSFKDRSVSGTGYDSKTKQDVSFYVADWRDAK